MTNNAKTIDEKIQERQEAFADADTTLRNRQKELAEVQTEIEEVQGAWNAGDDTVPAARMVELRAEEDRLLRLIKASQRQVQVAERRLLPEAPLLADAIAYALGASVIGIKAEPVLEVPEVEDLDTPHLFVWQKGNHTNSGGAVAGRDAVEIVLVAPSFAKDLDPQAIETTLERNGVKFGGGQSFLRDNGRRMTLPEIKFAQPEFPHVPYPSPEGGYGFDSKGLIERESHFPIEDEAGAFATDPKGSLVETDVTEDGYRETTVELVFSVRNNPEVGMDLQWAQDQGKRIVADELPGKVLAGIGRVTDVEVMGVEPVSNPISNVSARKLTVRVTARGRA